MARILVVDDEWLITSMLAMMLEDNGHYVLIAHDGQEGLERALKEQPEIVITDYMMPRMSGIEMIRRLRGAGFEGAIIVSSAVGVNGAEFDFYLKKPYVERDLVLHIEKAEKLNTSRRRK